MVRLLLAWLVVSLAVFALQEVPRGHGAWTLGCVVLVAATLAPMLALGQRKRAPPAHATGRAAIWACAAFALAQLGFALVRTVKVKVIDIGATTLAAVTALAQGGNPYALAIDPLAGGMGAGAASFHGYKYLPAMLAVYAPLCLALGLRGIVVTNMVLQGATAAALRALAKRGGGAVAGNAVAAIYLGLPFVAFQLFRTGANDLAAVLPLLLALLLVERHPFWSGVLVGLSLGAKLMPALAVLPCLMPRPGERTRYAAGVAVGLLPIVPFAAAAPGAFAANILLFNALRPIDDTSWLYGLSGWVAIGARAVAAAALAVLYRRIWRRPPGLEARGAACVLAILLVFAVAPEMHHNYYLWFIPFLAPLAARAAIGATEEAPLERMKDAA
jgi:hypothetical protein